MLRIIDPTFQHLKIARDHGQKVVEVVSDAAGELADGLHLLRLPEILLHFDARRQVPDEAGEYMSPAELHLANSEFHWEDGTILALRLHLPANADDALLAGLDVSGQVAVMVPLMRRGHEHSDVAPDHLTGSVAEQLFCGFAEVLDDAALVDRDDRVGGGLKNGAEPGLSLLKHR